MFLASEQEKGLYMISKEDRITRRDAIKMLGAGAISLGILSSCGNSSTSGKAQGNITVWFWSFLAMLMIPSQVTLIPQYLLLAKLDWLNSYQALILPGITSAFGIFLVRQYLLGLPRDFEEAARIDGASEFQIYARIVLPMLKPAIATLATIQFLNYWNDFLYPLVVTTDSSMRTLPAGLAT
jgi:ABC-type glycerol-3-phosphate transport system permease component